ncbi:ammonia-forming cytochrome c nitrite reductase subunit c552 [Syntrophomonas erecta]
MKFNTKTVLWIVVGVLLLGGIILFSMSNQSLVLPAGATTEEAKAFEEQYKEKTPLKYQLWKDSAHGKNGVTCINCHERKVLEAEDLKYADFAKVSPETCAKCHEKEYAGWKDTRHVEAVAFSQKNVRNKLLDGFVPMQNQGCDNCHIKVGNTCTSCHQAHVTDLPKPEKQAHQGQMTTGNFTNGCENCHMGPDHPQREAYESSVHYQVAQSTGQPTCNTCHTDPDNNHLIIQLKGDNAAEGRDKLWSNCLQCHTEEYVADARANVEAIKKESGRLVEASREIIRDLYRDGVLKPSYGSLLDENGVPLLNAKGTSYSHVSHIESLMFELFKYADATTVKGAQHFSADYTHWHGLGDLWSKYIAIKEEAERLYLEAGIKKQLNLETVEYPMFKYENETGRELESLK